MRPLFDRAGSRAIDQRLIDAGVPGLILMENAGRGAAEQVLSRFRDRLGHVVILGGTGQNGGDAWVIARRLATHGVTPRVVLAGDESAVRGDAGINLGALRGIGLDITVVREASALELDGATLIVDGLFGTGLDRVIEGWRAALIAGVNASDAPVVALDLPSGIDADTGAVLGAAIEAELTVTFAGHKRGLWQMPGRAHAGEVVCADIGVPPPRSRDVLLELADVARWVPRRSLDAHKGRAGHVLIVAGAPGRTGAAMLSGHGALRGGAGLVTLLSRAREALDPKVIELMTAALPSEGALEAALAEAQGKASAAIGPGLGLDADTRALVLALTRELPIPAVLDADALTAIAGARLELVREAAAPRVLTPHPGEAARLLGCTTHEIEADRYAAAARLAARSGHVAVLKGAGTVIADPAGRLAVCPLGTPALGVAGTGDVLSGALAAALASIDAPFEAACAAVLLHARAGELAARSDRGLLAREVGDMLPVALEDARA